MTPAKIWQKSRLYLNEIVRLAGVQTSATKRLGLMGHTFAYHWHNWRTADYDLDTTFEFPLRLSGKTHNITLRPRAGDMAIFHEIFTRDAYASVRRQLPADNVNAIIDAGAHVGLAALYFADQFPDAHIYCIEPNLNNFALLKNNVANEPRIVPIHAALTGLPNQEVFISGAGPAWGFKVNSSADGDKVTGMSIEQIRGAFEIESIDILKIDIEGGEADVFSQPSFLEHVDYIIAELHEDYDKTRFCADLEPFGLVPQVLTMDDGSELMLAGRPRRDQC